MNYEDLEKEIASILTSNLELASKADIYPLPEKNSEYKTPTAKGLILVAFMGEKPEGNQSIGQISQHTAIQFMVSVQSYLLRGDRGVYNLTELVKNTLIGRHLTNVGALFLGEHKFSDYQNEIWEHAISFGCKSLRVQNTPSYVPGTFHDGLDTDNEIYYSPINNS